MNKFGRRSLTNLETCHPDLQLIAQETIKICPVDFGISEGHRTPERQKELFDQGKSCKDGYNKKSKHNLFPSMAFDFFASVPGNTKLAFDNEHLTFVAGMLFATAMQLYNQGKIKHKPRWGGNWDGDGTIIYDHTLKDRPHFEIINY